MTAEVAQIMCHNMIDLLSEFKATLLLWMPMFKWLDAKS